MVYPPDTLEPPVRLELTTYCLPARRTCEPTVGLEPTTHSLPRPICLEPKIGFEPITFALQKRCSAIELLRHIKAGGQNCCSTTELSRLRQAGKTVALPIESRHKVGIPIPLLASIGTTLAIQISISPTFSPVFSL